MTRGKQKLYLNLIGREAKSKPRKRNHLMPERNKALTYRYYYHLFICRKRYEDALAHLTAEFFISETTIVNLLTRDEPLKLLQKLTDTKAEIKDFKTQYPQWCWKTKVAA